MAFTLNGIGTAYYGARWLPDGTYITTKWIVVIFLPIIPVESVRVHEVGRPYGNMALSGQSMKVERVRLDYEMVVKMYAWLAAGVAFLVFGTPWLERLVEKL